MSLLFQKTNQHSSQHKPEEVAMQYNYVTAMYLFHMHPHVNVQNKKIHGMFFKYSSCFLKEKYEERFPYLIGWQKTQNSLANSLTH